MTTAADLVEQTRAYLMAGARENLNILSGAHDASTTTFTFTDDLNQITPGSTVAVDLEVVHVRDTNPTSKTATVIRGMYGSTAATHADGSLTYASPRFPTFSIFTNLNYDLSDLSSPATGLYGVFTEEITFDAASYDFDLENAVSVIDILEVQAQQPNGLDWVNVKWGFNRDADTTDFPSGFSISFGPGPVPGRPVRVTYSQPFTRFTALTDTIATAGLSSTMDDLPPLGAAMRLAPMGEVSRNRTQTQGDTRRASEVPPSAIARSMQPLAALRQSRIKAEAARLKSAYPFRRP